MARSPRNDANDANDAAATARTKQLQPPRAAMTPALRTSVAHLVTFGLTFAAGASALTAHGFDGLVASELPPGGDVTVPGDYPIMVPGRVDVMVSGVSNPQSLSLTNTTAQTSTVQIFAQHERKVRTLRIQPGTSAVYSFKNVKPVRIKVTNGDIKLSSVHPLKVQR